MARWRTRVCVRTMHFFEWLDATEPCHIDGYGSCFFQTRNGMQGMHLNSSRVKGSPLFTMNYAISWFENWKLPDLQIQGTRRYTKLSGCCVDVSQVKRHPTWNAQSVTTYKSLVNILQSQGMRSYSIFGCYLYMPIWLSEHTGTKSNHTCMLWSDQCWSSVGWLL